MPRIELIPPLDSMTENPSPVVDLCQSCADDIHTGDKVDEVMPASMYDGHTIGSTNVVHPPYESDAHYHCQACDGRLSEEDN